MTNTNADWVKWGKLDPYFGVVASPKFHRANIGKNKAEFFSLGEKACADVMGNIKSFYGSVPSTRVLDFGCGVGRVLISFARAFETAVGVDVSSDMLEEARENCDEMNVRNIFLIQSDDVLSQVAGQFDLVHSQHVLQHIPVSRGLSISRKLLSLVAPGGFAMLHYSIQSDFLLSRKLAYYIKHSVPFGINILNILQGKIVVTSWHANEQLLDPKDNEDIRGTGI